MQCVTLCLHIPVRIHCMLLKQKGSYICNFITISMGQVLLDKPIVAQLVALYESLTFITVFTRARHWSLFWATWIQSMPSYRISLGSILILSFHIRIGKWSWGRSVNIATSLWDGRSGFDPRQRQRRDFFSSPPRPDRLWGPTSLLFVGYRPFPWG
jgi:hypothetical protein